jgi:DNA repair protein RecN (Recombination protein N)
MLVSLQIRNFALIENATIDFGEGLNILSGETGAGKSIVVQALELLLGGRGSADLIRQGEEEAEVTGLFSMGRSCSPPDPHREEFTLRRVISRNGKNRAYLNERPVTVAALEEAGEKAVDLANQHEHQNLLQPEKHLPILDEFAGLAASVKVYQEALAVYRALLKDKEEIVSKEKEARGKEEFLRFQWKELSEARIQEGEEEKLLKERDILKHAVRLGEICQKGDDILDSGEEAVTSVLGRLQKEIDQAAAIDPEFSVIGGEVQEGLGRLQEAARLFQNYSQKITFDPGKLEETDERLALISRLKKKHGGSLETLKQKEEEIRRGLDLVDNFAGEIRKQEEGLQKAGSQAAVLARELSKTRKEEASRLSKAVEKDLKELGIGSAKFCMELKPLTEGIAIGGKCYNDLGIDGGEFLIAPNSGEGLKPLAKIASGGELSRIFLAIKKIVGGEGSAETFVFDEVDAGIGGAVAETVGKHLSQLARKKQVVCITHLPQIACYADQHYVICKRTQKGRTQTQVERLRSDQREEEIARMLAGLSVTERAMAHAREMLKNAGGRG